MNHNIITLAVTSRQEAMNQFIVIIIALAVILLIVLILGSKNSKFHKLVVWMFEEDTSSQNEHQEFLNGQKSNAKIPRVEYVVLVRKIDKRKREIDARIHTKISDEYYELVFRTRDGEEIHIVTNKEIYKRVPFNQKGSLTFLKDSFIKFKTGREIIENEEKKH